MGAQSHARPVRRLHRIGERIAPLDQCHGKFVRQVRVAAGMSAALRKAQMGFLARIIHALRRADLAMLFGRRLAKSGHFTKLGILGSGFLAVCTINGWCSMS